jgi:hypothetical protein
VYRRYWCSGYVLPQTYTVSLVTPATLIKTINDDDDLIIATEGSYEVVKEPCHSVEGNKRVDVLPEMRLQAFNN